MTIRARHRCMAVILFLILITVWGGVSAQVPEHVIETIKTQEPDLAGTCQRHTKKQYHCVIYKTSYGVLWVLLDNTRVLEVFLVTPEGETRVVFVHPSLTI